MHSSKKREEYREIPDDIDDDDELRKPAERRVRVVASFVKARFSLFRRWDLVLAVGTAALLFGLGFLHATRSRSSSFSAHEEEGRQQDASTATVAVTTSHSETLPTLLSLHDGESFLYALDNPLYEDFKVSSLEHPLPKNNKNNDRGESSKNSITLTAEPSHVALHDPLTLRWDDGALRGGVSDEDVFVLVCGDDPRNHDDEKSVAVILTETPNADILEVATVEQVRSTAAFAAAASSLVGVRNAWRIPRFPVVRRSVCQFVLYKRQQQTDNNNNNNNNSDDVWLFLAASNLIRVASITTPTGVHLAYGNANDASQMTVRFATGGRSGTPVAVYGVDGAPPSRQERVTGTTTTYEAEDLCAAPANQEAPGQFQSPGLLHEVVLPNLLPETTYQYKVGVEHGQGVTWSDVYRFTTPPALAEGDDDKPFALLVYGDQGCPKGGWEQGAAWILTMVQREIAASELPLRAVHHVGDLSYARGAAHIWDAWFDMVQPLVARVPLYVAVGNHEYDHTAGGGDGKDPSGVETPYGFSPAWGNFGDDSGGECGVPTAKRFSMPASPGSNGVFWYKHRLGTVQTIVVSSEHDMSPGSPQYTWLEDALRAVDRKRTPWLIVEMHRPLYEGEEKEANNAVGIGMRYEMEDLLFDYQVDLVIAGHYHAWHRTCDGLYQSACDNGGPTHLTVGTAGASLDDENLFDNDWSEKYVKGSYGYGRISVMNATAMHIEFVKANEENAAGAEEILDDYWLLRERSL